jgi:hypothetical protein
VRCNAENFLTLAKEGVYDRLLFTRVWPNRMIQSGNPNRRHATKLSHLIYEKSEKKTTK